MSRNMPGADAPPKTRAKKATPVFTPEQQIYQSFSTDEDKARTNLHYELPVEFFKTLTGGEWNVYSANTWNRATTETESQEEKLDLLGTLMGLRPGMRILDVGCGWGGPLVYLSRTFGVEGVGLTLSPIQKAAAEERVARYGANVTILERHWKDHTDERPFDAIYTDEVIVHFNDLGGYFAKAYSLLRPGGLMLNKEVHYAHRRYAELTRAMVFVNEIYGFTGNYRTLADELTLVGEAGFDVRRVESLSTAHYVRTVDQWSANLKNNRARLEGIVGREMFRRFQVYLALGHHSLKGSRVTLDVVVAQKPISGSGPALIAGPAR
jgi:cyclopropane-fatty-acyl-phospholipid synthase